MAANSALTRSVVPVPSSDSLVRWLNRGDNGHFDLTGGVLSVRGTGGDDVIRVWETADSLIRASITSGDQKYQYEVAQYEVESLEVRGLNGNDTIKNLIKRESKLIGGYGDDTIEGGRFRDVIFGNEGNDSLKGNDGDDILRGGNGTDSLIGGKQDDRLFGEAGTDSIDGGKHNDRLYGGKANDVLRGGSGDDILFGDEGNDSLFGAGGIDRVFGGDGADQIRGGFSDDYLFGESGDDVILGEHGSDHLDGGYGNDHIKGGNGHDRLLGGSGIDKIEGGLGNDGIISGAGYDEVYGNGGTDRFLRVDNDAILDFVAREVLVDFYSTQVSTYTFGGQTVTFAPGFFLQDEIIGIDRAMALIQQEDGSTRLLKSAAGQTMKILRHGRVLQGDPNIVAWNFNSEEIHVANAAFLNEDWLVQTIVHEFGHNFDQTSENETIAEFRALSGWQFDGQKWVYQPGRINFTRDYSRTNPYEDFATAFAAYFLSKSDYVYIGTPVSNRGVGAKAARDKMAYMEAFLANG